MTPDALATKQLQAYNAADLDAFCACFHDAVLVLDERGREMLRGSREFRERYAKFFGRYRDVRAEVITRVTCGPHAIDHERWSRTDRETGEATRGEVLARYTVRDGLIGFVEFLK